MNRKEFYNIVKAEGLSKFNIGDSFEIPKVANVVGCINDMDGLYMRQMKEVHIMLFQNIHQKKKA